MNITMIDDSFSFNGSSPEVRALGGAEKALINLSRALSLRGHNVTVINRCEYQSSVDGVLWLPFNTPRPPKNDIIIAFRKPELLAEFEDDTFRAIIWLWGDPSVLNQSANQEILERYDPAIVFLTNNQRRSWISWRAFEEATILPGVADSYIEITLPDKVPPPIAIITTHPLHGLKNILDLWRKLVYPKVKSAELHIYSASMYNNRINIKLREIYKEVVAARAKNVFIKQPNADKYMAEVYRQARVHLYPVIKTEYYGSTLAETQACGTPAVIYQGGANGIYAKERISDGQTGYISPDDDAFANLVVQLLSEDSGMYWSLSREAKTLKASRSWQNVAIEFEALWK